METLKKIAKAELMLRPEYELGDFTLEFIGFECICDHNTKFKNVVVAKFNQYALDGEWSTKPEMVHSYEMFTFGFVTPKGYKSKKQVPVSIKDKANLTLDEVAELKKFKSEYKLNTFDPFYAENQAQSRNAGAWAYVAQNFITDPWCTR